MRGVGGYSSTLSRPYTKQSTGKRVEETSVAFFSSTFSDPAQDAFIEFCDARRRSVAFSSSSFSLSLSSLHSTLLSPVTLSPSLEVRRPLPFFLSLALAHLSLFRSFAFVQPVSSNSTSPTPSLVASESPSLITKNAFLHRPHFPRSPRPSPRLRWFPPLPPSS